MSSLDYKLEVEKLTKEIKKLKADKDFVWALWKRLQLSTPDVADAMSLVAQREKEKSEASFKDLIDEITVKDGLIKELSDALVSKEKECESLKRSKEEIALRSSKLENQCSDLTEKASKLDRLLSKQDDHHQQREVVTAYEHERKELLNTVSRLQSQITALRDEKNDLKLDNVDLQETVKKAEHLKETVSRLRDQVDEADVHISTQEETIRLLKDQLERNIEFGKEGVDEDGYSSDRTEENRSSRRRGGAESLGGDCHSVEEGGRPETPIKDLNYKVDRLAEHMRQLQCCVSSKCSGQSRPLARSRSNPPRRGGRYDTQREESARKIHFLTQKLAKTECLLAEEKKVSSSATEFLKKANSRVQGTQLTIKQLRKQIEDNKLTESEWKSITSRLENEMERYKIDLRVKDGEIVRLGQNAMDDASRIQDLLNLLEKTRYELTENKISSAQQQESEEVERLKSLSRQLETEKSTLEMKLSNLRSEFENMRNHLEMKEAQCKDMVGGPPKSGKGKRVKILAKKQKRYSTRKIKSMQSILNHFGGVSGDGQHSEGEGDWEDEDGDEAEAVSTGRTSTSQSTSASVGTKIVRIASRGRCRQARCGVGEAPKVDAGGCGQCAVMRGRVAALRQQLVAVTSARDGLKAGMGTSTRRLKLLQVDLTQANARTDRLLDAIKKQSGRIQVLCEERRQLLGNGADLQPFCHERMWTEMGIEVLDVASVAKAHLDEVASQVTMVRDLHQELGQRDVQLVQTRERLEKAERENGCKKRIIEDLRAKLQSMDGVKERERRAEDSRGKQCKDLEDSVSRLKVQLESLQTRLNVVLNERRKFEQEASNLSVKLEWSEKRSAELRHSRQILEQQVGKIEQERETKVGEIVAKSDQALDRLGQQAQLYKVKCAKYENLVVNLSRHLGERSREIRRLVGFGQSSLGKVDTGRRVTEGANGAGYEFARNKAADILSLSSSEIDSLLRGDSRDTRRQSQANNSAAEARADLSSLCKSLLRKDSFEQDIQSMFVSELDRIVETVVPASSDSGCLSCS